MRLPRSGSEPTSARSPYGLRAALAIAALVGGLVGAGWFGPRALDDSARSPAGAALVALVCLVVAVTAAVDLIILRRRTRRGGVK